MEDHVCSDLKTLVSVLSSFNVNVSIKDLKQPNLEAIVAIYKGMLETCLSVKTVTYDMDPPDAIIHFPEEVIKNQSESFKFLQLYLLILYFYDMCGQKPTFLEIFNPTRKLLNKQLSSLINFAKFEFNELNDFSAIQESNKHYLNECHELQKAIDELKGKVFCLKSQKNERAMSVEAVKKRIAMAKERKLALETERKKYSELNQAILKEENAMKAENNELINRQNTIKKKETLYEKLLIKSPERLKRDMDKNQTRIQELEKVIKKKTEENDELKKVLFERQKFIDSFKSVIEILENFYQNDVMKANSLSQEIEKEIEEITSLKFLGQQMEAVIAGLTAEGEKLNEQIEVLKSQLTNTEAYYSEKIKEGEDKCKKLIERTKEYEKKTADRLEEISKVKTMSENSSNLTLDKIINLKKNQEIVEIVKQSKQNMFDSLEKEILSRTENCIQTQMQKFYEKALEIVKNRDL